MIETKAMMEARATKEGRPIIIKGGTIFPDTGKVKVAGSTPATRKRVAQAGRAIVPATVEQTEAAVRQPAAGGETPPDSLSKRKAYLREYMRRYMAKRRAKARK